MLLVLVLFKLDHFLQSIQHLFEFFVIFLIFIWNDSKILQLFFKHLIFIFQFLIEFFFKCVLHLQSELIWYHLLRLYICGRNHALGKIVRFDHGTQPACEDKVIRLTLDKWVACHKGFFYIIEEDFLILRGWQWCFVNEFEFHFVIQTLPESFFLAELFYYLVDLSIR